MITMGKICTACGKERKPKSLMYDPKTFKSYCHTPYICTDEHPNSPKNLIKRGSEMELVDFTAIQKAYESRLLESTDPEEVAKIYRLMRNPATVRITDPKMAKFLVEYARTSGLDTMSDVFRLAIETLMQPNPLPVEEEPEMEPEPVEPEPETKPEPQAEEKPDDEDMLTF